MKTHYTNVFCSAALMAIVYASAAYAQSSNGLLVSCRDETGVYRLNLEKGGIGQATNSGITDPVTPTSMSKAGSVYKIIFKEDLGCMGSTPYSSRVTIDLETGAFTHTKCLGGYGPDDGADTKRIDWRGKCEVAK